MNLSVGIEKQQKKLANFIEIQLPISNFENPDSKMSDEYR